MKDPDFEPDPDDLNAAISPVVRPNHMSAPETLPEFLPLHGMGSHAALRLLAPQALGGARRLGAPEAFAHMDPPTPWVTWVTALWTASVNQNLLHPDVAPVARDLEARAIDWIAPTFGMNGGHLTPGSTVSNLTALWAARELKGVRRVVASTGAHLSVRKAAHILGLDYVAAPSDASGRLDPTGLPEDLNDAALVLTAGATSTGAVDPMWLSDRATWTHVDAAWAGPMRFSDKHGAILDGIEAACSIAISGHKWLFQPKESAMILFRDTEAAHSAVSFGGAYLTVPNTGVLGSHGATAIPLLATLLAWGKEGIAWRIDRAISIAEGLYDALVNDPRVTVFGPPSCGVLLWRPKHSSSIELRKRLPEGLSSLTQVGGQDWLRQVAANPMADLDVIRGAIQAGLQERS